MSATRPVKFVFKSSRGTAEVVFRTSSGTAKIRSGPAFGEPKILVYINIHVFIHA